MTMLIVDRRGARIELANPHVIRLDLGTDGVHRIGINALKQIILVGDVDIKTSLLRQLLNTGVNIVLLPSRGREPAINLFPQPRSGTALRLMQYRAHIHPKTRLALAKTIVCSKLTAQSECLNQAGYFFEIEKPIAHAQAASDLDVLRGVEGATAARYFSSWSHLWQSPWFFNGRNRRPPRDPVNALLSLCYTLAVGYVGHIAIRKGYDPTVGFLHGPQRQRPAIALDLIEPLRPRIDQWVWQLLNQSNLLTPDSFTTQHTHGCRLNRSGRAAFFAHWYADQHNLLHTPTRNAIAALILEKRHHTLSS